MRLVRQRFGVTSVRSGAPWILGAVLFLMIGISTPARAQMSDCVSCQIGGISPEFVNWWCVASNSGTKYCVNLDLKRQCWQWGECSVFGIGGGHDPVALYFTTYAVDEGNRPSLPATVNTTSAHGLRSTIAALYGLPLTSVHLRGRGFIAGAQGILPGLSALKVAGSRFAPLAAGLENGLLRVKICGYPNSGGMAVLADADIGPDESVLVALQSGPPDIIVAIHGIATESGAFVQNLVDWQIAFEDDVTTVLEAPLLGITVATAPVACAP